MKFIERYWIVLVIAFLFLFFVNKALGILILGSVASYFSIVTIKKQRELSRTGLTVVGKIKSYTVDSDGYSTPIIQFTTLDGSVISKEPYAYVSTDVDRFQSYKSSIDTNVVVLYDPANPEDFVIANEKPWNDFVFFLLGVVGVVLVVVSMAAFSGYIKL